MEPRHERIARIALAAGARYGLALAGGFTRFASTDRIIIVRKDVRGERRIPFDFSAVVEKGDLQQNLALQSGDTVIVP